MPRIKLLSEALQNLIAAGEVIERPASIVKELVENSLDAGSTDIRIDILKGGKRSIRVDDNGDGMSREDARLCFLKHATSKLGSAEDLHRINTMGFRGEALSSVAAVSKMRIRTSEKGQTTGTEIQIDGGDVVAEKDATSVGTSIEVRDLFYNTPARKKFLKKDNTELHHIVDVVTKLSLINFEVSFTLRSDGRDLLRLHKASGLKERIIQHFGMEMIDTMIPVSMKDETRGISISGFIASERALRRRRANQYLFVNGRPIMDSSLRHAIYKAYEGFANRDEHPLYLLDIKLAPGSIDVNVHPAKREIRFLEMDALYDDIRDLTENALKEQYDSSGDKGHKADKDRMVSHFADLTSVNGAALYSGKVDVSERPERMVSEPAGLDYKVQRRYLYLGDVFAAYTENGIFCIVDHHAAHERVLYEKLRGGIGLDVNGLLFPKQVRLGAKEYLAILDHIGIIKDMGMDVEDFGGNTVIVRSVPSMINESDISVILEDMATGLTDIRKGSPVEDIRDDLAKRVACHSSIRGKRLLGNEQMTQLLKDLEGTDDPHHCPHGRPTRLYFSQDDLKKMFERM